jgi:hypothetical protein
MTTNYCNDEYIYFVVRGGHVSFRESQIASAFLSIVSVVSDHYGVKKASIYDKSVQIKRLRPTDFDGLATKQGSVIMCGNAHNDGGFAFGKLFHFGIYASDNEPSANSLWPDPSPAIAVLSVRSQDFCRAVNCLNRQAMMREFMTNICRADGFVSSFITVSDIRTTRQGGYFIDGHRSAVTLCPCDILAEVDYIEWMNTNQARYQAIRGIYWANIVSRGLLSRSVFRSIAIEYKKYISALSHGSEDPDLLCFDITENIMCFLLQYDIYTMTRNNFRSSENRTGTGLRYAWLRKRFRELGLMRH